MKNVFVDDSYLTATANAIRAKNNSTDTYKPSEFANAIASISGGGADGVGIQSVVQTTTSAEDGGTNVITVTKTDGTTSTFQVKNGSKGSDGVPGADGKDGADGQPGTSGKSAYQYAQEGGYTGTEEEFAAKMAQEIPTVDATLTQAGQAADAAAVGEQLGNLSEEITEFKSDLNDYDTRIFALENGGVSGGIPSAFISALQEILLGGIFDNNKISNPSAKISALSAYAGGGSDTPVTPPSDDSIYVAFSGTTATINNLKNLTVSYAETVATVGV